MYAYLFLQASFLETILNLFEFSKKKKDFSFDTIKEKLNDIACILIYVTDKFKSSVEVLFFKQLKEKKVKRIIFLNDGLSLFVFDSNWVSYLKLNIDFF